MEAMYDVYKDCNDATKNICGTKSCKSMTLDLGGAGKYYKINKQILKDKGLDVFNNWLGPNAYCERDDADYGDYEIDAYYSNGGYHRVTNAFGVNMAIETTTGGTQICKASEYMGTTGFFDVPHGAHP